MTVKTEVIDGQEVKVEEGEGVVASVDERTRNFGVEIRADGLKFPVKGWADKSTPMYAVAFRSKQDGTRVTYRVEIKPKGDGVIRDLTGLSLIGQPDPNPSLPIAGPPSAKDVQAAKVPPVRSEPPPVEPPPGDYEEVFYGEDTRQEPPIPRAEAPLPMAEEMARLSHLLDQGLASLRQLAQEYADAENEYRKGKAESWLRAPSSPERSEWTSAEREAWVGGDTADLRRVRDYAEAMKQAALEAVRSRRTQLSCCQTLITAHKAEADLAKYGPEMTP